MKATNVNDCNKEETYIARGKEKGERKKERIRNKEKKSLAK